MNSYEEAGKLAVDLGKTASVLKKGCPEMAENYEKMSRAILRTMLKKSKDYASGVTGKEFAAAYVFDGNLEAFSELAESNNKKLDKVMKNRLEYCRNILD